MELMLQFLVPLILFPQVLVTTVSFLEVSVIQIRFFLDFFTTDLGFRILRSAQ